jgi:hypothetical protein
MTLETKATDDEGTALEDGTADEETGRQGPRLGNGLGM